MQVKQMPDWLKNRGYLHITRQIDVRNNTQNLLSKICNPSYIAKYAFFPLIHASIDERRYKPNPELTVLDQRKRKNVIAIRIARVSIKSISKAAHCTTQPTWMR